MKKTKLLILFILIMTLFSLSACDFMNPTKNSEKNRQENQTTVSSVLSDSKVTVPNITGMKLEDAKKLLNDKNLSYTVSEVADATVEEGYVVNQAPSKGSKVNPFELITIYVSKADTSYSEDDILTLYCRASDFATLRDTASRKGVELAKIKSREKVTYISTSGEFYYVLYKGGYGYVLADFFSVDPDAPLNYGSGSAPISENDFLYCRASNYANLRKTPSTSAKSLGKIYCREKVTYLGSSGSFYYVSYRGTRGYVLKDYFSTDYNAPLNYGSN